MHERFYTDVVYQLAKERHLAMLREAAQDAQLPKRPHWAQAWWQRLTAWRVQPQQAMPLPNSSVCADA